MPPLPDIPAAPATDQQFAELRRLRTEFSVALFSIPALQTERVRQLEAALRDGRSLIRLVFSCEEGFSVREEAQARIAATLGRVRGHLAQATGDSPDDLRRRIGLELGKIPLGPEAALRLATSVGQDDPGACELNAARKSYTDARNQIFLSVEPFRRSSYLRVVPPYRRSADLWQASAMGVLRGIERYSPSRGASLPMVLEYFIKCAVADLRRTGPAEMIPVSPSCAQLLFAARTALAEPGRRFDGESLARHVGAPKCLGSTLLHLGTLPQEATEEIPDYRHEMPGAELSAQDDRALARRMLAKLPPRKEAAIRRYFGMDGEPCTHEEISAHYGTKTRAVGMMIQRALERLRQTREYRAHELS